VPSLQIRATFSSPQSEHAVSRELADVKVRNWRVVFIASEYYIAPSDLSHARSQVPAQVRRRHMDLGVRRATTL